MRGPRARRTDPTRDGDAASQPDAGPAGPNPLMAAGNQALADAVQADLDRVLLREAKRLKILPPQATPADLDAGVRFRVQQALGREDMARTLAEAGTRQRFAEATKDKPGMEPVSMDTTAQLWKGEQLRGLFFAALAADRTRDDVPFDKLQSRVALGGVADALGMMTGGPGGRYRGPARTAKSAEKPISAQDSQAEYPTGLSAIAPSLPKPPEGVPQFGPAPYGRAAVVDLELYLVFNPRADAVRGRFAQDVVQVEQLLREMQVKNVEPTKGYWLAEYLGNSTSADDFHTRVQEVQGAFDAAASKIPASKPATVGAAKPAPAPKVRARSLYDEHPLPDLPVDRVPF